MKTIFPQSLRCLASASITLFVLATLVQAQTQPAADLIIHNAKIWTVDQTRPAAQAVAVLGDRIVAVGSDGEVEPWHGPRTRTIDAKGKVLLPGFNDAHIHFVDGGLALDSVQLNDATSAEEFSRRIAERAKKTPSGEWVTGGDWDETKWTPASMPTKELIDSVTSGTPSAAHFCASARSKLTPMARSVPPRPTSSSPSTISPAIAACCLTKCIPFP